MSNNRLIADSLLREVVDALRASGNEPLVERLLNTSRLLSGGAWTDEDLANEVRQYLHPHTATHLDPLDDQEAEDYVWHVTEQIIDRDYDHEYANETTQICMAHQVEEYLEELGIKRVETGEEDDVAA